MEPSPQGYNRRIERHFIGLTSYATHRLAGGDLENLGGKTDWALDTELLVLCAGNQISRDCGKVINDIDYLYKDEGSYTSPSS